MTAQIIASKMNEGLHDGIGRWGLASGGIDSEKIAHLGTNRGQCSPVVRAPHSSELPTDQMASQCWSPFLAVRGNGDVACNHKVHERLEKGVFLEWAEKRIVVV